MWQSHLLFHSVLVGTPPVWSATASSTEMACVAANPQCLRAVPLSVTCGHAWLRTVALLVKVRLSRMFSSEKNMCLPYWCQVLSSIGLFSLSTESSVFLSEKNSMFLSCCCQVLSSVGLSFLCPQKVIFSCLKTTCSCLTDVKCCHL